MSAYRKPTSATPEDAEAWGHVLDRLGPTRADVVGHDHHDAGNAVCGLRLAWEGGWTVHALLMDEEGRP